jgi:hypothetical protein
MLHTVFLAHTCVLLLEETVVGTKRRILPFLARMCWGRRRFREAPPTKKTATNTVTSKCDFQEQMKVKPTLFYSLKLYPNTVLVVAELRHGLSQAAHWGPGRRGGTAAGACGRAGLAEGQPQG